MHSSYNVSQPAPGSVASDRSKLVLQKLKVRLDVFLSRALPDVSRSRLKQCIKDGQVFINGCARAKPATSLVVGDVIACHVPQPKTTTAKPEAIPVDIAFEDDSVIVVNKPAGMVVHPSPGHDGGTLVNAILHHCGLPEVGVSGATGCAPASLEGWAAGVLDDDVDDDSDMVSGVPSGAAARQGSGSRGGAPCRGSWRDGVHDSGFSKWQGGLNSRDTVIRPGIVHRLDKGTTGLMVVCKTDHALAEIGRQFKERLVRRLYWSITVGVPREREGGISTNICRHPTDRKKMAPLAFGCGHGREAVSTYSVSHGVGRTGSRLLDVAASACRVLEELAEGTAALVQWKLHTGRTHQIRVHAQHLGHPLLGDGMYGGVGGAYTTIGRGVAARDKWLRKAVPQFGRPALHAKTLGFQHPTTAEELNFGSALPHDFERLLEDLRDMPPLHT